MRPTRRVAILSLGFLFLAPAAWAGQYPAWGDTGWIYAGKRDCCDEAIALAQQQSAAICRNLGGVPSPMRGGVRRRGNCKWESSWDEEGITIFRCQSEAAIWCR